MNLDAITAEVESVIMAKAKAKTKVKAKVKTTKARVETEINVIEESIRFKTGSDLLDLVIGGGLGMGVPAGKIINIVGDKSSGKTFYACELIAAARHQYKTRLKWKFDDCESGYTFDTKHLYGFEIMPENEKDRHHSETVEDLYCNVRSFAESLGKNEIGIYVVDSLDGLTSEESDDLAEQRYNAHLKGKTFDKGSYKMGKAKYLSQEFFPQLADFLQDKNVLLVIISQIRDNVEAYSHKEYTRAGGRAMDFYCHSVVFLATMKKITKKGRAIGVITKAKTTKSKTPRPFRETMMPLLFDYGIDNIGANIDFLFDLRGESGALLSAANALIWEGKGTTKENVKGFLERLDYMDEFKSFCKKTKTPPLKKQSMIDWIVEKTDLKEEFEKEFGTTMTRDQLIDYIEEKRLTKPLKERVIAKWEAIEESIKNNRNPKYVD